MRPDGVYIENINYSMNFYNVMPCAPAVDKGEEWSPLHKT